MNNEYKQATMIAIKASAIMLALIAVMSALIYHFGALALVAMLIVIGITVLIGIIWFISLMYIEQQRRE